MQEEMKKERIFPLLFGEFSWEWDSLRVHSRFFLAICQFLWYAVDGAVSSTPVGGSPRFSSGVMLFFAPNRKKGGVHMVTWEELIQFGLFLVALISLVLQANNKKK